MTTPRPEVAALAAAFADADVDPMATDDQYAREVIAALEANGWTLAPAASPIDEIATDLREKEAHRLAVNALAPAASESLRTVLERSLDNHFARDEYGHWHIGPRDLDMLAHNLALATTPPDPETDCICQVGRNPNTPHIYGCPHRRR